MRHNTQATLKTYFTTGLFRVIFPFFTVIFGFFAEFWAKKTAPCWSRFFLRRLIKVNDSPFILIFFQQNFFCISAFISLK